MKITPELIAKLIYSSSELRYFERELVMEPSDELHDVVIRCQFRLDGVLVEMGMKEFIPLEKLIELINLTKNEITT